MMIDLKTLKLNATFKDVVGEERTFTSMTSLTQFFEKENEFWQEKGREFSKINHVNGIIQAFANSKEQINTFINNFSKSPESEYVQQFQSLTSRITEYLRKGIFSESPFAKTFLDVCQLGPNQANIFWDYVNNHEAGNVNNLRYIQLEGALRGYDFMSKSEAVIKKRLKNEERSLSDLRKFFADQTDEVITARESFEQEIKEWQKVTQEELAKQRENDRKDRDKIFNEADTRMKALEKLYGEMLKLKKPATYWNEQSIKFKKAGYWWGGTLVLITLSSGSGFGYLFLEWLKSDKAIELFSAGHWQGIILLVTILSLIAFLIRSFAKLTFSSFHLQRDAEERELLAYLYLALSNESEIDIESRKIVLQSLFSRSETGLLSGDHGPTMPGISEAISRAVIK